MQKLSFLTRRNTLFYITLIIKLIVGIFYYTCRIIHFKIKTIAFILKCFFSLTSKTICGLKKIFFSDTENIFLNERMLPPKTKLLREVSIDNNKTLTPQSEIESKSKKIVDKLATFGIKGEMFSVQRGTLVDLFEFLLQTNTKVNKILALENDLAMVLKTNSLRIIAPIPGKNLIGFEVAKKKSSPIYFANTLNSKVWKETGKQKLSLLIGQSSKGTPLFSSLVEMPHLLIAGATGSGKSVCIHTLIASLLFTNKPSELKLILIDPKRLEMNFYKEIPHLLFPIITEIEKVSSVLAWLIDEMMMRYSLISKAQCRDVTEFNKKKSKKLPYIVLIIDELADLIMVAGKEVELKLIRLGQMARAAGIHLIVATQRPSVDVVTGLIKVNFPTRITFRVSSKIDSRVIIDVPGAEKLLGKGDMLFMHPSQSSLLRLTGSFISAEELELLGNYLRSAGKPEYIKIDWSSIEKTNTTGNYKNSTTQKGNSRDDMLDEIVEFLHGKDEISISLIQRSFGIGFNRAAKIIETLEEEGVVGTSKNGKSRKVL